MSDTNAIAAQPQESLLITGLSAIHSPGPPPSPDLTALLCGGGSLLALLTEAQAAALRSLLPVQHIDAAGLVATPGLIDLHVHLAGGGGEAGPASRTPEAALSELIDAGLTTVVGVTGTDSVTRSQENLVAKVQALSEDLTALHWCGAYCLPPPTATGSVQRDLCLLPSCVGVGEVAVSDHRGSAPTPQDLLRLGLEARVGGMLGGKAGLVHVHVGPGAAGLAPLREALAQSCGQLPISTFHPTHMGRSAELVQQGIGWLRDGGSLDVTADSQEEALAALRAWRAAGVPMGRVTASSDAYGSLPVFDEGGKLVGFGVAKPDSGLRLLRALVDDASWSLDEALQLMTSNPAALLKLPSKGRLAVGADADILLLEPDTKDVRFVIARGRLVKTPEWTLGGMFEQGPGIRPKQPRTEAA